MIASRGAAFAAPRSLAVIGAVVTAVAIALGWLALTKTTGRDMLVSTADRRSQETTALTSSLTRVADLGAGTDVQVILTPQAFFQLTGRAADGRGLGADRAVVFVMNANTHYTDLPHHFGALLRIDGLTIAAPTEERVLTDAVHHRTSALIFGDVPANLLEDDHTLELLLPTSGSERAALPWRTPIAYPDGLAAPATLSLGLLLALGAGLLAAISPCLLQVTAFYLPTLAGVSADGHGRSRGRVIRTAALFVAGFTIPYTIGGALMGGFGAAVAASGLLTPTGTIAEGAGVVMIAMAVLVAYRARAPLVCSLPLPGVVERAKALPYAESFVSGFAIATGCLACFGGAILGVLLVYTGLLGSALLGGLAMFVFSLGLAIPFLAAAFGLSRIEPFVNALQRVRPAIGLVTGAAMAFFGVTMATGNYHLVSGWLVQHLPLG